MAGFKHVSLKPLLLPIWCNFTYNTYIFNVKDVVELLGVTDACLLSKTEGVWFAIGLAPEGRFVPKDGYFLGNEL